MNANADHRLSDETPFEPFSGGWMYRSEAFAEDVDHLLSVAVAVATGPFSTTRRDAESLNPASWPALLAGALLGRPQGAG